MIEMESQVIIIQLSSRSVDINLIQLYAPTATNNVKELLKFYNDIKSFNRSIEQQGHYRCNGDLNA